MKTTLTPTRFKVVRPIPASGAVCWLVDNGYVIVGGFPLWLAGGSPTYSDVDVYSLSEEQYAAAIQYMMLHGAQPAPTTPNTVGYVFDGVIFQLVFPHSNQKESRDIIYTTDISPSACMLVKDDDGRYAIRDNDGEYAVDILYPDDIKNRVCRILIEHEWTWHRIETYIKKGYRVEYDVWDNQLVTI